MAKDKQGFIKLNRGFFDNFLWNEARTYSKAEAWLDLIQMASEDYSLSYMPNRFAEQWMWNKTKVFTFLKTLNNTGLIEIKDGDIAILDKSVQIQGCKNHFNKDISIGYKGVNFNRKTKVYFLRLYNNEEAFVKIGIAFNVKQRIAAYHRAGFSVEIISVKDYTNRYKALYHEKKLHEKYKQYQHFPKTKFGGFYECFSLEILLEI